VKRHFLVEGAIDAGRTKRVRYPRKPGHECT
jgi:hypothetical protein